MRKHVVAGALAAAVATSGALALPAVDASWKDEFRQDLAVLRRKLDILRTLMNGR